MKNLPKSAELILRIVLPGKVSSTAVGDYEELYSSLHSKNRTRALLWLLGQIIKSVIPYTISNFYWRFTMLRNDLKIALRNILKRKLFSIINITGLTAGITCCLLIFLYIQDELKFDRFNSNYDILYRIVRENIESGDRDPRVPAVMLPNLKVDFPEIDSFSIMTPRAGTVSYRGNIFNEDNILLADDSFFKIFDFNLLNGDPETALTGPARVVLTESTARKYFGDSDPTGEIIKYDNRIDLTVSGILEDPPVHSHLDFDLLVSFATLENINSTALNRWTWQGAYIYFILPENIDTGSIERRLDALILKHRGDEYASRVRHHIQHFPDIYLNSSDMQVDIARHGNGDYIFGFSAVAIMVLAIACFNYMNLSTAKSSLRAGEVGLKKVFGARRKNLVKQFIFESFLFVAVSVIISLGVIILVLPSFNSFTGKMIILDLFYNLHLSLGIAGGMVIVTLLAGCYPAFYLTKFKPVDVLRSRSSVTLKTKSAGGIRIGFRQVLVLLQFTISIGLITGTSLVSRQLDLFRNKQLGFDKENMIVIENPYNSGMETRFHRFKSEIEQNASILGVSAAFNIPPHHINNWCALSTDGDDDRITTGLVYVDQYFLDLLDVDIIEGRNFSEIVSSDTTNVVILNRSAIDALNIDSPIGKFINGVWCFDGPSEIIGVADDMNYFSLHSDVPPMVFCVQSYVNKNNIVIKTDQGDMSEILGYLETKWKETAPEWPFKYYFIDQKFDSLYQSEIKMGKIVELFTFLVIFIAYLGLFGLASFIVDRKTKEVGVRKVLGASVSKLVTLLSGEFIFLIVISSLIAWPVTYYAIKLWLSNFAFQVDADISLFIMSSMIALLITIITVGYRSLRAALSNPADVLKHE